MNYELGIMNGGISRFPDKRGRSSSIPHSSFLIPRSLRAFTLIELLVVIAIMGLMGTVSIGGYRAMRRGMEERGVTENVTRFVESAKQRAAIDRQPTAIYFWNETRREESDDGSAALLVVGRAVAVRCAGRVSRVENGVIVDEFGDLRQYAGTDDEGEESDSDAKDQAENGLTMRLYKISPDCGWSDVSDVGQSTMPMTRSIDAGLMTDPDWVDNVGDDKVVAYGYKIRSGNSSWKAGEAYGVEFASMTLPNNYIFESNYKSKISDPILQVGTVLHCRPSGGSGSIAVCSLRPGDGGAPVAKRIGTVSAGSSADE